MSDTAVSPAKKWSSDLLSPASRSARAVLVNCWRPIPGNNPGERGLCLTWTGLWLCWKSQNNSLKRVIPAASLSHVLLSAAPRESISCHRHLSHFRFHFSCLYTVFVCKYRLCLTLRSPNRIFSSARSRRGSYGVGSGSGWFHRETHWQGHPPRAIGVSPPLALAPSLQQGQRHPGEKRQSFWFCVVFWKAKNVWGWETCCLQL